MALTLFPRMEIGCVTSNFAVFRSRTTRGGLAVSWPTWKIANVDKPRLSEIHPVLARDVLINRRATGLINACFSSFTSRGEINDENTAGFLSIRSIRFVFGK